MFPLLKVDISELSEVKEIHNYLKKAPSVILKRLRVLKQIDFDLYRVLALGSSNRLRQLSIGVSVFREFLKEDNLPELLPYLTDLHLEIDKTHF